MTSRAHGEHDNKAGPIFGELVSSWVEKFQICAKGIYRGGAALAGTTAAGDVLGTSPFRVPEWAKIEGDVPASGDAGAENEASTETQSDAPNRSDSGFQANAPESTERESLQSQSPLTEGPAEEE
ncbi:MAG TPA: hypothetical protein PLO61_06125 [Fimbriimonadaceae bacterium]|nr:hypothetical protein [Fimbriimonadaceae bacterium]HRJ33173.1 hypothetical protein [Fimbriimonadaceae bacterium]